MLSFFNYMKFVLYENHVNNHTLSTPGDLLVSFYIFLNRIIPNSSSSDIYIYIYKCVCVSVCPNHFQTVFLKILFEETLVINFCYLFGSLNSVYISSTFQFLFSTQSVLFFSHTKLVLNLLPFSSDKSFSSHLHSRFLSHSPPPSLSLSLSLSIYIYIYIHFWTRKHFKDFKKMTNFAVLWNLCNIYLIQW